MEAAAKSESKASAKSSHTKCHTAEQGEPCFTDVIWAMTEGIINHKEWYDEPCPNLDKTASFEVFQACVYKINHTKCGLPCNPTEKISQVDVAKGSVSKDDKETKLGSETQQHFCHTSMKGNKCYNVVLKAMERVKSHPDDYPGLNESSPFEDFQTFLHKRNEEETSCPKPCACHTAVTGERCFEDVTWAMTEGVGSHGKWYVNLSKDSTFEDFQNFLHKDSNLECPLPCQSIAGANKATLKPETTSTKPPVKPKPDAATATPKPETTTTRPPAKPEPKPEAPCHTSVEGEECHKHVHYALSKGIYEKPDWYEGLTRRSTFEDFQALLHKNKKGNCPKPCKCHTAKSGEKCLESIHWVLLEGLKVKPRWYPGLSPTSRFEEVQARLHEDTNSSCPIPCQPALFDSPSLFCYSLFRSSGYELDLAKFMVSHGWGIFNCDDFAVLSDTKLPLEGVDTIIIPPCEVGVSKDGTAANTLMFMRVWDAILNDVRYRLHDWIVKVDPDAVMFPDRLRGKLEPYTGQSVYVKNCDKYTGEGWPMMFGSLEAISKTAIQAYFDGAERCRNELEWQAWGEDLFMMKCFDHIGVGSIEIMDVIGDNVCKGADCADGLKAVYHPFKSVESWSQCFKTAIR